MVKKKKKRVPKRKKTWWTRSPYVKSLSKKLSKKMNLLFTKVGKITFAIVFACLVLWLVTQLFTNRIDEVLESPEYSHILTEEKKREFVRTIAPIAQKLQKKYGVFASVSMAQAMIESQFGVSQLAAEYYNLFGVKTEASDPAGVDFPTQEFVNGEWVTITDRFKVYKNWEESMTKHAELIYYGTTWNPEFYKPVLDGKTYTEQANGLQTAGYATDPTYASKVISVIEEWDLTHYDRLASE